jgi:TRAP-type uncharacterized transport system substrate-binding protein
MRFLASIILVLAGQAAADNDVASIAASTKGTLFDQAATAVAKVATNNGDLQSTLRNYTSANVFVPAVARGLVDFGVANQYEVLLAMTGQSHFKGREQPNLRAVAVLFPLYRNLGQTRFAGQTRRRSQGPPDARRLRRE